MATTADAPQAACTKRASRRHRRTSRGAVYVEFLIAFLPFLFFFFCIWQLGYLLVVGLATQHSAMIAARTAAVVLADDPKRYNGAELHKPVGGRKDAVELAALAPLAPFIIDGSVRMVTLDYVNYDEQRGYRPSNADVNVQDATRVDFVRIRVNTEFECSIPLAKFVVCPSWFGLFSRRSLKREAQFPYQGATFDYYKEP